MTLPYRIALFLAFNALGFFSMAICYFIGLRTGRLEINHPDFNPAIFQHIYSVGMLTWVICALFSIAFFFLKGKEKYFFLAAPVIFPLAYGFRLILDLF